MGIDFEIVAYRGKPASVEQLAQLIARHTPYAELFRHSIASDVASPLAPDLHFIAFYDDQHGESHEASEGVSDEDSRAPAPKPRLYFRESGLAAIHASAAKGLSLADVVKQAWSHLRQEYQTRPAVTRVTTADADSETETSCAELARDLSRGSEAFLLGYADHSCTGIYAQFRDGELVLPASTQEIYGEHEDYMAWPSQQWSRALGTTIDLDQIVASYFPDARVPLLYRVERPSEPMYFNADRFSIGLSESI
jgi:hypothetical protein